MTDKEIINGLIVKDNQITADFSLSNVVRSSIVSYGIYFRMKLIMMSLSMNYTNILWK